MGFTDSISPEGGSELSEQPNSENKIPETTLIETPILEVSTPPEPAQDQDISHLTEYSQLANPVEAAPVEDTYVPETGSVKIINQNSVNVDFSGGNETSSEVTETTVDNEIAPEVAEDEGTSTDEFEGGVLDVMDVEGVKDSAETQKPDDYETGRIINPEDPPAYPQTPLEINNPKPSEGEDTPKEDPETVEIDNYEDKSEQELRKEQNIELMNTLFENHKKAFIKPEGKDYLILRDSKNRVLEINGGSLIEQSGGDYSKYTYIFSEKGVSMVVFDERLYNKDYSSNLDNLLDADFSENKDDKYIKVKSSDGLRSIEANVRNCKNIAELDKNGIKGIIEFVESTNPAPPEKEEIKTETESLRAFYAET